jgi:hypothetical protein
MQEPVETSFRMDTQLILTDAVELNPEIKIKKKTVRHRSMQTVVVRIFKY